MGSVFGGGVGGVVSDWFVASCDRLLFEDFEPN